MFPCCARAVSVTSNKISYSFVASKSKFSANVNIAVVSPDGMVNVSTVVDTSGIGCVILLELRHNTAVNIMVSVATVTVSSTGGGGLVGGVYVEVLTVNRR